MRLRNLIMVVSLFAGLLLGGCASSKKQTQDVSNLDAQLDDLVKQIVLSLSQNQKTKIAVIEFSDIQGNVTNLGRFLAEELTTRLYRTGQFDVVERQLLNKLMKEHQLSLSGMIDENSAVALGKILGVNAIASGSTTDLGSSVKINARLISAETGKVFSVASVSIFKDDTIRKLLAQSVHHKSPEKGGNQAGQVIEKEDIKFELIKAKMSGRTAIVQIKLTNLSEEDKDFEVTFGWQYQTKIFDDLGNEALISAVKFANQKQRIKGISQYDAATKKIIAGSSVTMELYFDKASSKATKINLLQILCGYRDGFKVEFRNIPIEGK